MLSLNSVNLVGRLAEMPTYSTNERGSVVASCKLLVTDTGTNDVVFRTFIPIQAHGKTGERLADLSDGDLVGVSGRLSWVKSRNRLEVFVLSVETMDDEP